MRYSFVLQDRNFLLLLKDLKGIQIEMKRNVGKRSIQKVFSHGKFLELAVEYGANFDMNTRMHVFRIINRDNVGIVGQ